MITESDQEPNRAEAYYTAIEKWTDERLVDTYRRLSRDLRIAGDARLELYERMIIIEAEMTERGLDAHSVAKEVQAEREEFFE